MAFDFSKKINGFKFSFLEGLNTKNNKHGGKTYDIQLFTINNDLKEKYWVATIHNCYVLTNVEKLRVLKIYKDKGWFKEQKNQLNSLGLWNIRSSESLKGFGPNVKFHEKDVLFYDPPIAISENEYINNRDRYLLYDWDLEAQIEDKNGLFNFVASKPSGIKKILRKKDTEFYSKEIIQLHRQISNALYSDLSKLYGGNNIACDLPTNFGTYIDMVQKSGKNFIFYEIKTYNQLRKNIREALGQLLEYAYWNRNKTVIQMVIVSNKPLDKNANTYLLYLKEKFNIPITYRHQKI